MKKQEVQIISRTRVVEHGEVLTSSREVEAMLDMTGIKKQLAGTTFLEPACGTGNFLVAILRNKLAAAAARRSSETETWTALNSIYGIDIQQDNVLTARERLSECFEKYSPCKMSPEKIMAVLEKNIIYADALNTPPPFLHSVKFDVIIGNPPYQQNDGGGTGDSAVPIYHRFVELAMKLEPKYIIMIIPSRWMKGGKGLKKFRTMMIHNNGFRELHDFENGKSCFPELNIDGGVCYFLWDRDYTGPVDYFYRDWNNTLWKSRRYLKNDLTDIVIRDHRQIPVIQKAAALKELSFSDIVASRNPFGICAGFFNTPEKYPFPAWHAEPFPKCCMLWGVKGKKGGARRIKAYIHRNDIPENAALAVKWKLFFSKACSTSATVPPEIIIGGPGSLCTETFLCIGSFDSREEAANCLSYIKTRFFRALLFFKRHSLNISKDSFSLIPLLDFSKPWSDEELYARYNFSAEDISYIESRIRPME